MKYIFSSLFLLIWCAASAQMKIPTTDSFIIKGTVKQSLEVTTQELEAYPEVHIDSIVITNQLRRPLHTLMNIAGVSLKKILDNITIDNPSPKDLSSYYFEFVASDNYTIVFSWNEIFNTPTGEHIFIIMEKDGKKIKEQSDRISMLVATDFATGRRYLKGLKYIIIKKAD